MTCTTAEILRDQCTGSLLGEDGKTYSFRCGDLRDVWFHGLTAAESITFEPGKNFRRPELSRPARPPDRSRRRSNTRTFVIGVEAVRSKPIASRDVDNSSRLVPKGGSDWARGECWDVDGPSSPSGGKKEQGPTAMLAFLAFLAFLAMWFV